MLDRVPLFWQICIVHTEVLSYFTFLKLVCIGETKRRLKDRFNERRRAVDKNNTKSKSTTVSEHFLSHSNHSHTDMQLIPLEKIHSSRDSVRKARESHLIDKAMTLEPTGLNRHDELLLFFLFQFFFGVVRHFCLSLLKTIGSFSTDDGNCSENVSFKMNSRFFNLCRVYSTLLKMADIGEFPWS